MKIIKLMFLHTLLFFSLASNLMAKTVEVKMLNKGSDGQKMVFEPSVVFIEKGDSVKFISVNKGHNVASLDKKGSAPEGSEKWKSKISKDHTQTFNLEGIHGVKCKPHLVMGMVGAVVVGNTHNLEAFSKIKLPGRSKKRFPAIITTIKERPQKGRTTASVKEASEGEEEIDMTKTLAQLQKDVSELKAAVKTIQNKLEKLESK